MSPFPGPLLCLALALGGWINSHAQMPFFEVKALTDPSGKYPNHRFLLLQSPREPKVAKRISQYLQIGYLGQLARADGRGAFTGLKDPRELGGTVNMDFEVLVNTERLLSLRVKGETCGAYCEPFSSEEVFDSHTGNRVSLQELFSPKGLAAVTESVQSERQRQIQEAIQAEEEAWKQERGGREEGFEASPFWNGCLAPSLPLNRYYVQGGDLHFVEERCSNHASRATDSIGSFDNARSIQDLRPFLNGFGRYLLLGEREVPRAKGSFSDKLMTGTLAGKKILMVLHLFDDGSVGGSYLYEKHGEAIPCSGHLKDDQLTLDEQSGAFRQTKATFQGTVANGHFRGTWTATDDAKKVFSFEASW